MIFLVLLKKRIQSIIEELEKRKILGNVYFIAMFKADLVDDEMCILLKKLGVKALNFGFESGSQKILSYLKKDKLRVDQIKNAIRICKKHNMKVFGSLMFGSPGETIDDMQETLNLINFMKKEKVDGVWAFITSPFPGTELWKYGLEKGLINNNFDFDYSSHYNTQKPIFLEKGISLEKFNSIYDKALSELRSFSRDTWKNRIKRAVIDPMGFIKKVYNLIFIYSNFSLRLKHLLGR